MEKWVLATHNTGKAAEFRRMLTPLGIELVLPRELGITTEVAETGVTFLENARQKAQVLYEQTGLPSIGDDSGLCVDALEGAPGVYTARYGGQTLDYPAKMALLLQELAGLPQEQRTARFVCSIYAILGNTTMVESSGTCEGWIGFEPAGTGGFGYDPLFYIGNQSLAQLPPAEKDALSHRGKALQGFVQQLQQMEQ